MQTLPLSGLSNPIINLRVTLFPGATAAKDAKCFTCIDLEQYVFKNLSISKRLKYMLEFNRGEIAHKAFLGERKKIAFTRTTSAKMIRSEDRTTLLVAARCTPSNPWSVV